MKYPMIFMVSIIILMVIALCIAIGHIFANPDDYTTDQEPYDPD